MGSSYVPCCTSRYWEWEPPFPCYLIGDWNGAFLATYHAHVSSWNAGGITVTHADSLISLGTLEFPATRTRVVAANLSCLPFEDNTAASQKQICYVQSTCVRPALKCYCKKPCEIDHWHGTIRDLGINNASRLQASSIDSFCCALMPTNHILTGADGEDCDPLQMLIRFSRPAFRY